MKHLQTLAGLLFLIVPVSTSAASVFDLYYEATQNEQSAPDLAPGLAEYVIEEMKHWQSDGIKLTIDDIQSVFTSKLWTPSGDGLCQGKRSVIGDRPYTFVHGGGNSAGSCLGLLNDIAYLMNTERRMDSLGTDLLSIAGGAEASIADEPAHAVDMASMALILRRVWSGTGASVIPWDGSAEAELTKLDNDLAALSKGDLDKAILRFRHGMFREQREADPRFAGVQDGILDDLNELASKLGLTGDPEQSGVFSVPRLRTENVAVWARDDDLGLFYVYPTHFPRLKYAPADQYPVLANESEKLAYPFEYSGSTLLDPRIDSPLCSRLIARNGYLCRPTTAPDINCDNTNNPDNISLVKCGQEKVVRTVSGPRICPDFDRIFNNSPSLTDPDNPTELNPNLTLADTTKICSPESMVIYQDDIASHACYISFCLRQSMSGHTLIPNRNPVVTNEATSPFLACIKPDPQLGLYTEIVEESPYPLPEYLGVFLVRDFARQYCGVNGNAPQPLAGFCRYNDNDNAVLPLNLYSDNARVIAEQRGAIVYRQQIQGLIATVAGQRAALDQSIDVYQKIFAKLANFIGQTASLLGELKNAPLTKVACPWTGQFTSSPTTP